MGWWLTPSPRRNRPGYASLSVWWAADAAMASRAQMEAIPVATVSVEVPARSRPALVNASRPTASGTHTAPKPSDSISAA
jgi:hypothetical protein